MKTAEEIFEEIIKRTVKINEKDIFHKGCKSIYKNAIESIEFQSKTRKAKYGRVIFIYLIRVKDHVVVLLNTGKNPIHRIDDPKNIIIPEPHHKGIYGKVEVKPEELRVKYTLEDVDNLIRQSYEMLDLKR